MFMSVILFVHISCPIHKTVCNNCAEHCAKTNFQYIYLIIKHLNYFIYHLFYYIAHWTNKYIK